MKNRHLLLLLFVPLYLTAFYLIEKFITTDYWVSYIPLDDSIPFLEVFVIPYCIWYPFMIVTGLYLLLKDVPAFKRYMWFIIIGFTTSLTICALLPNGQHLRPLYLNVLTFVLKWWKLYIRQTQIRMFCPVCMWWVHWLLHLLSLTVLD